MIDILVFVAIFVIVAVVIWWILSQLVLPEPIRKIILIVFVVIAAIFAIALLLNFTGHASIPMRLQ